MGSWRRRGKKWRLFFFCHDSFRVFDFIIVAFSSQNVLGFSLVSRISFFYFMTLLTAELEHGSISIGYFCRTGDARRFSWFL